MDGWPAAMYLVKQALWTDRGHEDRKKGDTPTLLQKKEKELTFDKENKKQAEILTDWNKIQCKSKWISRPVSYSRGVTK